MNKVFHFILKRELKETCEICIEEIKKGQNVFLTECCNTYYHKDCLIDSIEKCPHCRQKFKKDSQSKQVSVSSPIFRKILTYLNP